MVMEKENNITPINDEIVIYQTEDGSVKVDVLFQDETVWLTQEQMALLFGKSKSTINEHILNIYQEGELLEKDSKRKIGISDFSTKPTNFYNLDVIISVGYRVKSRQGTMFRIWATQRLRDYIIRGYALNERNVLEGLGKISHELAKYKAESEYLKYKEKEIQQIHFESIKELDKDLKQLKNKN